MRTWIKLTGVGILIICITLLILHLCEPKRPMPRSGVSDVQNPSGDNSIPPLTNTAFLESSRPLLDLNTTLSTLKPTRTSSLHAWVETDGKDTNFLKCLALNDLHYEKMVEENPTIFRRQLVYRFSTLRATFQLARQTGQPIQELVIPGLDGQEILIEPSDVQLDPDCTTGYLTGRIKGNSNSIVTIAFKEDREAFIVIDHESGLHLVGEPREPGQIIVKLIDPTTYGRPHLLWPQDFIPRTGEK